MTVAGETGKILRLHAFHVLQTLSPHTAELDVGVPARGLHGEAYRGHVFWDELFVLPYITLHFPEVARALLMYRHRRLPAARDAARQAGQSGAMFPWQSGSSGQEESQALHLNPRSGRWLPDHSHLQRHVGSAIALNVCRYGRATGDTGFLHGPGAELLLEITRFWAGAVVYDTERGRYRIRGVLGPDEYHDAYPGASEAGIDDNAYTNVMAAWVIQQGLELLDALPPARRTELTERLALDRGALEYWEEVSHRLYVPFHRGVISQFEGYGDLAELDWAAYRARYGDVRRLDRILEAEGDTVNRYQASKQADAIMLGHLFRPAELYGLFARLGYRLDETVWRETVSYYLRRTSHGSTLSSLVHGWVLARQKDPDAWKYCQEALLGDVADIQGGTTGEGIHLGAMAAPSTSRSAASRVWRPAPKACTSIPSPYGRWSPSPSRSATGDTAVSVSGCSRAGSASPCRNPAKVLWPSCCRGNRPSWWREGRSIGSGFPWTRPAAFAEISLVKTYRVRAHTNDRWWSALLGYTKVAGAIVSAPAPRSWGARRCARAPVGNQPEEACLRPSADTGTGLCCEQNVPRSRP